MLDFPNAPTVGQKYPAPPVVGIPTYTWDGEKWTTVGGSIGDSGAVRYDTAQTLTAAQKLQARQNISVPIRGHIFGLTLSYVSGTVFGVALGSATDNINLDILSLAAAVTKTTAAWAVGSGNGALGYRDDPTPYSLVRMCF